MGKVKEQSVTQSGEIVDRKKSVGKPNNDTYSENPPTVHRWGVKWGEVLTAAEELNENVQNPPTLTQCYSQLKKLETTLKKIAKNKGGRKIKVESLAKLNIVANSIQAIIRQMR